MANKINGINENKGFTNGLNPVFTRHQKGSMSTKDIQKKREELKKERLSSPMAQFVEKKQAKQGKKFPVHLAKIDGRKLREKMLSQGLIVRKGDANYGFEPTPETVLAKHQEEATKNTNALKEAVAEVKRLESLGVKI